MTAANRSGETAISLSQHRLLPHLFAVGQPSPASNTYPLFYTLFHSKLLTKNS